MIRNLIWDVDGTLFDTYPAIIAAFADVCAERGKPVSLDRIGALARQSLEYCVNTLAGELGISPETIDERFGVYHSAVLPAQQLPFPGVMQVCETVHRNGGLNVIITHRGRQSTGALLAVHGLAEYFSDVMSTEDGYPRKPDPAAFVAMVKKHGFTREDTLAIGDRDIDTLAAQGAGLRACLFGTPSGKVAPDMAITDFAELLKVLAPQ